MRVSGTRERVMGMAMPLMFLGGCLSMWSGLGTGMNKRAGVIYLADRMNDKSACSDVAQLGRRLLGVEHQP